MNWDELLRVLAALAAGGLIGLERELHDKPAGFRTNILICLGAAVFTVLSGHTTGDSGRIAAQIVTGVGFLGAGAILHAQGQILGLTTAATIWAVASLGMAFGAGHYLLGFLGTGLIHGVLVGLVHVERWIATWRTIGHFEIRVPADSPLPSGLRERIAQRKIECIRLTMAKNDGHLELLLELVGSAAKIDAFQAELLAEPDVASFSRR